MCCACQDSGTPPPTDAGCPEVVESESETEQEVYVPEQVIPGGISMSVDDSDDVVVSSAAPVSAPAPTPAPAPVVNDPNGTGITEMGPLANIVSNSNSALTDEEKCQIG